MQIPLHIPDDPDDAFDNGGHIPDAASYPPMWQQLAARFRAGATAELDLTYGAAPRARFDLFHPAQAPQGLVVFVHGGFWRRFDKSVWSHLAQGALARGWAVAIPGYTLAPQARIAGITAQIATAIAAAADRVAGPIRLAGHSAGGHLVTRMVCTDCARAEAFRDRVAQVLSISGVHDLRPLVHTAMNTDLRLDAAEAAAESPALLAPVAGARVTCWAGGGERPEFLRQNRLLCDAWGDRAALRCVVDPGRHHFDVIAGLADPDSALTAALLG